VNRHRVLGPVAVAVGTAAVLAYDPFADHALGCPFQEATGLLCPGCGATRAYWLLLHGDLPGALRHNGLLLAAGTWLVLNWFAVGWPARVARWPAWLRSSSEIPPRALQAAAALLVAFTVLRNVPALDWLGPPTA
jgi:hypothetical protein